MQATGSRTKELRTGATGRKNRSFSADQIRAALAAYRTGAALLVIEAETGVPRTVLAYHRRKVGIPRRRPTRKEVGAATEHVRLRPLLERCEALVRGLLAELRAEIGEENS